MPHNSREGLTRISVTVHEPEGPPISPSEWHAVLDALGRVEGEWLVASGSLPRGAPEDAYAQIGRLCVRRGQRFVLDTSGAALKTALGNGVTLIKPSLGEMEDLVRDPREQDREAMELVRAGGVEIQVVSLGAPGAILATRDGVLRLRAPEVAVRSAVGAGDSFVAAMTHGLASGMRTEETFARGIAAGSVAVMRYGTAHPRRSDMEQLYGRVFDQLRLRSPLE